jgi:hypothetical protein
MRCIFCRCRSDNAKSVEHIVPESLGNTRHTLPKGAICDQCNNYFARKIEHPVLSHRSFRNLRAWNGIRSKKGRTPWLLSTHLRSGFEVAIFRDERGEIRLRAEKGKTSDAILMHLNEENEFNAFAVDFEIDPPQKEMSRCCRKWRSKSVLTTF